MSEQQESTLSRKTVEATLAEAMAHAEQCLRLITSAKETPGRLSNRLDPNQS